MVRYSFDSFLMHLVEVLKRFEECNLVLNWENYHFMVIEGIILGHHIYQGIEVDRPNVEVKYNIAPPIYVKGVKDFLGHAGFNKI